MDKENQDTKGEQQKVTKAYNSETGSIMTLSKELPVNIRAQMDKTLKKFKKDKEGKKIYKFLERSINPDDKNCLGLDEWLKHSRGLGMIETVRMQHLFLDEADNSMERLCTEIYAAYKKAERNIIVDKMISAMISDERIAQSMKTLGEAYGILEEIFNSNDHDNEKYKKVNEMTTKAARELEFNTEMYVKEFFPTLTDEKKLLYSKTMCRILVSDKALINIVQEVEVNFYYDMYKPEPSVWILISYVLVNINFSTLDIWNKKVDAFHKEENEYYTNLQQESKKRKEEKDKKEEQKSKD